VRTTDRRDPNFWRELPLGSIVTCKDEQAIEDSIQLGLGAKGLDYTVDKIERVIEAGKKCEWILFTLGGQEQPLMLMAKIVDRALDVRIYYNPNTDLVLGNRKDAIEGGNDWLFEPPTKEPWSHNDLKFIDQIDYDTDDQGNVTFRQKPFGAMYGTHTVLPPESGMSGKKMIASVVEYRAVTKCSNPELLMLEVGSADASHGGNITMWMGANADLGQIDVLPSGS
jgi:hypothetical protein